MDKSLHISVCVVCLTYNCALIFGYLSFRKIEAPVEEKPKACVLFTGLTGPAVNTYAQVLLYQSDISIFYNSFSLFFRCLIFFMHRKIQSSFNFINE